MNKISLTFNLPQDEEDFKLCKNGADLAYGMDEFDNWLRSKIKYGNLPADECLIYEIVRTEFWKCRNRE